MKRQSSNESNRSAREFVEATLDEQAEGSSDSEVSNFDGTEHISRPSNISSYAEYTESDDDEFLSSERCGDDEVRLN
jgi:hypothetical protein